VHVNNHTTRAIAPEMTMDALPQWLENAIVAAGMTAYAEGLEFVANKSATDNNQHEQSDPPGNVH
jgi:hypothetical protein